MMRKGEWKKQIISRLKSRYIAPVVATICLSLAILSSITAFNTIGSFAKSTNWLPTLSEHDGLVIDVMSVGSKRRSTYQDAQRNSFAKHCAVRFFFNITEDDDADTNCSETLRREDTLSISKFCRSVRGRDSRWGSQQLLMRHLENFYATVPWLKRHHPGWMCAQTRPSNGFAKVIAQYRAMKETHGDTVLPDYLFICDDDTYVNMNVVDHYMSAFDSKIPRAIAGCLYRSEQPVELEFSFPHGGFGTIFSKGTLERPINCSLDELDAFSKDVCSQVDNNQIGEKALFKDGMSVSDLQNEYATFQPFTKHTEWTTGFCLHSDWVWGFFINFYSLAKHSDEERFKNVPQDRIEGYNHSEMYGLQRVCIYERAMCDESSPICHYQKPDDMLRLANITQ